MAAAHTVGPPRDTAAPDTEARRRVMQEVASTFQADMTEALIPFVTFRTIADREHRAMAGLSMGGSRRFRSPSTASTCSRTSAASVAPAG